MTMKLSTLAELLHDQLKDLYSAESQLIKALPKMAKSASSASLRTAITNHLEETRGQLERLQTIGDNLGLKLTGKKCQAMEGLIEEGKEVIDSDGADPVLDLALIAAAQRVEHYEISAYGSARALAEQMGQDEVVRLLQATLDEESAADEKLTRIAEEDLFPQAREGEEDAVAAGGNGNTKTASKGRANGRGKK